MHMALRIQIATYHNRNLHIAIKALRANPRRRGGRLYADGPGWSVQ
jgi:hypothetical protein